MFLHLRNQQQKIGHLPHPWVHESFWLGEGVDIPYHQWLPFPFLSNGIDEFSNHMQKRRLHSSIAAILSHLQFVD